MKQLFGLKTDGIFVIVQILAFILKLLMLVDWDYGLVFLPSVFFLIYVTIRDEDKWIIYLDNDDYEEGDYEEEDY